MIYPNLAFRHMALNFPNLLELIRILLQVLQKKSKLLKNWGGFMYSDTLKLKCVWGGGREREPNNKMNIVWIFLQSLSALFILPSYFSFFKCYHISIYTSLPPSLVPSQRVISVKTVHQLNSNKGQNCGLWNN